jgi:transposase
LNTFTAWEAAEMWAFPAGCRVYVALAPVDMRKGFNGLYALVRSTLGEDPLAGGLFVFGNRDRTRVKILYWDGSGLWVLAKRLEKGSFNWPRPPPEGGTRRDIAPAELVMLLQGIDLVNTKPRKWYGR